MTGIRDLVLSNGRTVRIERIEGEVLHADRQYGLHVSSSGGGGLVGPQGGFVAAPTLTSESSEYQEMFLRLSDGTERSLRFRNWSVPVRPGNRIAALLSKPTNGADELVLAVRNMDIGAERWMDVRQWAQDRGLLSGKMRVWPSALIAALIGAAFVGLRTVALAKQGVRTEPVTDWMLVSGIAFVPILLVEWLIAIVLRATDGEPERVAAELTQFLRSG